MQKTRWTSPLSLIAALAVLGWGAALAWAAREHLGDQGGSEMAVPALLFATIAALTVAFLPRIARKPAVHRSLAGLIIIAAVALPASTRWPGGINYARFGFTVVGLCPIPAFDFTISAGGWIAPRAKTHQITLAEVTSLAPGAEVIVIANGWDSIAKVDPEALKISGVAIEVLPTGDALRRYQQLRREGRRVALLAHTTC